MKPVWSVRTGSTQSGLLQSLADSTPEDAHFLPFDIQGSIAHVWGLHKAGLLHDEEAAQLIKALQAVPEDLHLDPSLEDVHMNLEAYLHKAVGPLAKKIHTGRSRNDQVATCINLYARTGLHTIGNRVVALMETLQAQIEANQKTAWVAKTHGKPAQPATIAFLLHAHLSRWVAFSQDLEHVAKQCNQSALGSGAIAGSTLPLDPAFTAGLLGMKPPTNAMAATGTRDTITKVTQLTAFGGALIADLAQDLLQIPEAIASQHTTGSSLMPHKRNPDALELLRGHGKALFGAAATVHGVTAGMGLGYDRDLQVTKVPLLTLETLADLVTLMEEVVRCATFTSADLGDPGLLATDLAEALVKEGMPFRDAYAAVAQVYGLVEDGVPFEEAVKSLPFELVSLCADPMVRTTLGAPGALPDLSSGILEAKRSTAALAAFIGQAESLEVP